MRGGGGTFVFGGRGMEVGGGGTLVFGGRDNGRGMACRGIVIGMACCRNESASGAGVDGVLGV